LMNIPFIKNIIEEKNKAEGFWLDRRYCNEGNEYVGKKNNNMLLNNSKPNKYWSRCDNQGWEIPEVDDDVILMKHIVNLR
jgi:hypothetical protein